MAEADCSEVVRACYSGVSEIVIRRVSNSEQHVRITQPHRPSSSCAKISGTSNTARLLTDAAFFRYRSKLAGSNN